MKKRRRKRRRKGGGEEGEECVDVAGLVIIITPCPSTVWHVIIYFSILAPKISAGGGWGWGW